MDKGFRFRMVSKVQRLPNMRLFMGAVPLLTAALLFVAPEALATRAYLIFRNPDANIWVIYGFAAALTGLGLTMLAEPREMERPANGLSCLFVALPILLYFLLLMVTLQDWWIDDAGITFAYSRSLAEGQGLVAQPWLPPQEGYSSSAWMLLLSLAHGLGVDIPLAAKYIGTGFSALAMALCLWMLGRETGSPAAMMICGMGLACTPTVVWAASGQEHALQSLLLLLVVFCVYCLQRWRWPVAVILAVFVLTRPEAPIIVIAVFCAALYLSRRAGGSLVNSANAAVALLPFSVFCGLIAFRLVYFGDPMPNPYYAKSSGTALIGVFNPLGAGWTYILSGLRDTALLFIFGLFFLIPVRRQPAWVVIAIAVLLGQMLFVIWAKGDWMGQYRFLMPVLPIALLLAPLGLKKLGGLRRRLAFCAVATLVLVHTTVIGVADFRSSPTTPMQTVTEVGEVFKTVADRLEIADPLLAHHDAGGIAYHRMIRLLDLGGLVNREIAKNMDDRSFLVEYILQDTKPDFVFGGRGFAAATGFAETEAFAEDYVWLEFTDLPLMQSDLSYIRRDRAVPAPGIDLVYDDAGRLLRVVASGSDLNI